MISTKDKVLAMRAWERHELELSTDDRLWKLCERTRCGMVTVEDQAEANEIREIFLACLEAVEREARAAGIEMPDMDWIEARQ